MRVGHEKRINKLLLQSVTKLVATLRPKGAFWRFTDLKWKRKIKLFLPHPLHAMLCRCSSYLEIKTRDTSTLNGGENGGVWILLFSELILFECNNFVADCGLVFNLLKCHRHIEFISPLSEAFTTDHLYFNKYFLRIVAIMATVYLFKWAAWNFHRSCKWADFVAVQIGHKTKEKELKPRFHMLGKSYTIGDFTFCRLSQTLPIYWILATSRPM